VRRRLTLVALLPLPAAANPAALRLEAPNVLPIRAELVCSGQPTPAALKGLGSLGFDAVLYLAPASVGDAVRDEPELLRAQGIEFAHVPMPWDAPTLAQVDQVLDTLTRWQGQKRKVLVHCQVNMRASSLVFLYRVLVGREPPERAWADVTRIWSPNKTWAGLIQQALQRGGVAFDLL
jgi:protein tyrosine phosphatase (PTP) superfamily phosphohydrolase (DUF442 family)